MAVILDANLLVALATDEARAKTIADRFSAWAEAGEELPAPALMLYEAANALARLIAAGHRAAAALQETWAAIERTPITHHPLRDGHAAVELALRSGANAPTTPPMSRWRTSSTPSCGRSMAHSPATRPATACRYAW